MSQAGARRIRRVLVAVDTSPGSRAAVAAAARIAAILEAELAGHFVEETSLVRLAEAPHAHQVALHTDRAWRVTGEEIERQLRAQAKRARQALDSVAARAGVAASFRVSRGVVAVELLAQMGDEDLIIVGRRGWAHGPPRRLGSTARALLERRPGRVLLLAHGERLAPPLGVVFDGDDEAAESLLLAGRLAPSSPGGLVVFVADDASERRAAELLGAAARRVRFERRGATTATLLAAIERRRIGLLVLPAGAGPPPERLLELLVRLPCPVLVVR